MDSKEEKRLFNKVTKVTKRTRGHSKGSYCGSCRQHNQEGTEDRHGIWHYRCPYCVSHQNPKGPDPCPRCGCTSHERLGGSVDKNPFRPDIEKLRCLNCSLEWYAPAYETYLLTKAVKSILSSSGLTSLKPK